jgi:HK97 family phage major capsid protein
METLTYLERLKRDQAQKLAEMREVLERVEAARTANPDSDGWTDELRDRFDAIDAELARLEEKIYLAQQFQDMGGLIGGPGGTGRARYGAPLGDASFADLLGTVGPGGAGDYLRAVLTGRERPGDGRRSLSGSVGASGGYLVPGAVVARVLDLARSASVLSAAGIQTIPLEPETVVAKVTADPVPQWRGEGDPIAEGAPAFGAVTFHPRALAVVVKMSLELVEDAPNLSSLLETTLAEAFAREIDRVVLYGAGTSADGGIIGLRYHANVARTSMGTNGAALTNHDRLVDLVSGVLSANYTPTGIVAAPRTEAALAKLKDTNNQYLRQPSYLESVRRYQTSAVRINETQGTATNASTVFCGDWTQVAVGIRSEFTLIPLRERYMDSGEVGLVGWLRADVAVLRPEAFQLLVGVTP